jgi:hypothetical protein
MVWIVPAVLWLLCDALMVNAIGSTTRVPELLLVGQVVAISAFGAVVLAGCAVLRRRPGPRLVASALTLAAVAASPIPTSWDDGCNLHTGTTSAALAPIVEQHPRWAFGGTQTLMACVKIA